MVLAPIYCDICEHRIGPSEPISEINGKIVGLCHAQTAKTVQQNNPCLDVNISDKLNSYGKRAFTTLRCTPDHMVLTTNGMKAASELTTEDHIFVLGRGFNFLEEQVLIFLAIFS